MRFDSSPQAAHGLACTVASAVVASAAFDAPSARKAAEHGTTGSPAAPLPADTRRDVWRYGASTADKHMLSQPTVSGARVGPAG